MPRPTCCDIVPVREVAPTLRYVNELRYNLEPKKAENQREAHDDEFTFDGSCIQQLLTFHWGWFLLWTMKTFAETAVRVIDH
jgi:hypothetical protein